MRVLELFLVVILSLHRVPALQAPALMHMHPQGSLERKAGVTASSLSVQRRSQLLEREKCYAPQARQKACLGSAMRG